MIQTGRIVTGAQIRAARSLLDWSRDELAHAAGLHSNAVTYWEQATVIPVDRHEPHACRRIRQALLDAGVEFVGHAKPGVRLVQNDNFAMRPPSRARPRHGVKRVLSGLAALASSKTVSVVAMRRKPSRQCGAKTRAGPPCRRTALANGRCPNHGGRSTGPRTPEGRRRIAEVQRRRWLEWRSHRFKMRSETR
jgi:hypothetical protein